MSGGRGNVGSTPTSSVYIWDLRSAKPMEELEKNQDTYSIHVFDNDADIFVGNRNHEVKHINIESRLIETYSPPHMDTVTSLTMYNGMMVSGSRDQFMKFWDIES